MDFTVTIDESSLSAPSASPEHEYNKRQRRLLHALHSNQERFYMYLQWSITSFFEGMNWNDWRQLLMKTGEEDSEEILTPVIATLGPADQQFFLGASEHGVFSENVEKIADCFSTELEQVEIVIQTDQQ